MFRPYAESAIPYRAFACIFFLWVFFNSLLIFSEARLPSSDIFLFKEAGARLALTGKFEVSNLPHMPLNKSMTYSYYVPVYPFLYGCWATAFGLTLKSSLAFDQIIKGIRTFLLLALIWPFIGGRFRTSWGFRLLTVAVFGLLSILPGDTDRPDQLAAGFGLAALLVLLRQRPRWMVGAFLGLTAASSPTAGIFFTLICLVSPMSIKARAGLALSTVLSFLILLTPIYYMDTGSLSLFFHQVPLSTFPLWGVAPKVFANEWYKTFWLAGKNLLAPALVLMTLGALAAVKTASPFPWRRFLIVAILFFPLSTVVWTYQLKYLWFPLLVTVAGILVVLSSQWQERWAPPSLFLLLLALAPSTWSEAKIVLFGMLRPQEEASDHIRKVVDARLQPGDRLVISSDQYFTFRPFREVSMAFYVCRWLEKFDAVYLSNASIDGDSVRPPCHGKRHLFAVDSDLRLSKRFHFLGKDFTWHGMGSSGVLFRKNGIGGSGLAALHH